MQQEDGVKYYMSGQMYKKMTYKEGKLDGPWEQFYQNGQVHYEGEFKDGRFHGKGIYIFADGEKNEGTFVNGSPSGKFNVTLANGDKIIENY